MTVTIYLLAITTFLLKQTLKLMRTIVNPHKFHVVFLGDFSVPGYD